MGKLSHLHEGIGQIKGRLAEADGIKETNRQDLDGLLDEKLVTVSDRVYSLLSRRMDEIRGWMVRADKEQADNLTKTTGNVSKATEKAIRDGISKLSEEVALSHNVLNDGLGSSGKSLASQIQALQSKIDRLNETTTKLPTKFPAIKETDLSGIMNALGAMKFPDNKEQFAKLEKRLSKRVYEFQVHRNNQSDLIERIVVVEK